MWSDGDQGRAAPPQPPPDADRRARLVRGDRHGRQHRLIGRRRRRPAAFPLGPNARVITDDGRDVGAGLGRDGPGARSRGRTPGRLLQGPREDGRHLPGHRRRRATRSPATSPRSTPTAPSRLLGRGSVCINTGGEKVFPEEVEEVLKLHPTVADAVVVGVPDERFGEAITAVVEPHAGDTSTRRDLIAHVKEQLAALQGAEAGRRHRHHRPRRQRQGRLQSPPAARPRRAIAGPRSGHGIGSGRRHGANAHDRL